MSKIYGYNGPGHPLCSSIEALTATCAAPYNHRAVGFRNCENAFHLAGTILGGRDIIEEFVAADVWPISYGWGPTEIVGFNMNWAAQEVPFPRFGLQLKDGQSAEEFMDEVEKKVNAMIGESIMNEYKAYKNLVKHKRRINRVFSEVCGEKSFCSRRLGIVMKAPAVVVASCSATPLKAPRRTSSKKGKGDTDETSSSTVRPEKTRSLESSKRKRKSFDTVSYVELQVASSLAQLSRKKTKKAVKKIAIAEVRSVPSAFDDDMIVEPSHKGFFSCLWPDLRFDIHRHCTLGSENEFVDVETFSDDVAEVRKEVTASVAAADDDEVANPQPSDPQDKDSPEFTKELEMTVHRGESPVQNAPLVETREDLPEG
jgi:DNA-directed RNA polymerase subunit N (RpoN/RPB10)